MSTAQKIIKYMALALAAFIIVSIISGILIGIGAMSSFLDLRDNKKNESFEISENLKEIGASIEKSQISSLKMEIGYSNLKIKNGDNFKIETNNSDISCKQSGNQLIIKEKSHNWFHNKEASNLVIYIPENMIFDEVQIETGAGEIEIEEIATDELEFDIGAGTVIINKLTVLEEAKIDGGAGKVEILSGEIHNLDLDMGAGKFTLESKLAGRNDIDQGVGKLELKLTDGTENYKMKVSKGIGSITIDGEKVENDRTYGDGESYIKIDGGIGEIDIN